MGRGKGRGKGRGSQTSRYVMPTNTANFDNTQVVYQTKPNFITMTSSRPAAAAQDPYVERFVRPQPANTPAAQPAAEPAYTAPAAAPAAPVASSPAAPVASTPASSSGVKGGVAYET